MPTPALSVRPARVEDADPMTETISTAFHDDPLWSWAFADAARRAEHFRVWWRVFVDACFRNEWTWVTEHCESVAIWTPPGAEEMTHAELVVDLIGGDHANAVLRMLMQFDAAHPRDVPHYYLGIVATHDDHRGHGIGEALLAENLKVVDEQHMPAYLESSNPANLKRYMRLGFEPTGEIAVPDGRPAVVTMWRPER
jgi:GNAT superfamily N-acetyltransferase